MNSYVSASRRLVEVLAIRCRCCRDDVAILFDTAKEGDARGTKADVVAACHAASAKSAVDGNFIVVWLVAFCKYEENYSRKVKLCDVSRMLGKSKSFWVAKNDIVIVVGKSLVL